MESYPHLRDLPAEELAKRREEAHRQAVWWERRNAVQSLIYVTIIVSLDAIVLVIHWWLVGRERRLELADEAPRATALAKG